MVLKKNNDNDDDDDELQWLLIAWVDRCSSLPSNVFLTLFKGSKKYLSQVPFHISIIYISDFENHYMYIYINLPSKLDGFCPFVVINGNIAKHIKHLWVCMNWL